MKDYIQALTTVDKRDNALKIADEVVKSRLVGCAQVIGPMTSIYWWKDKIETSNEWLILMKSKDEHFSEIEELIKKVHPYETPEIIAVPIMNGSKEYLNWLDDILIKRMNL